MQTLPKWFHPVQIWLRRIGSIVTILAIIVWVYTALSFSDMTVVAYTVGQHTATSERTASTATSTYAFLDAFLKYDKYFYPSPKDIKDIKFVRGKDEWWLAIKYDIPVLMTSSSMVVSVCYGTQHTTQILRTGGFFNPDKYIPLVAVPKTGRWLVIRGFNPPKPFTVILRTTDHAVTNWVYVRGNNINCDNVEAKYYMSLLVEQQMGYIVGFFAFLWVVGGFMDEYEKYLRRKGNATL